MPTFYTCVCTWLINIMLFNLKIYKKISDNVLSNEQHLYFQIKVKEKKIKEKKMEEKSVTGKKATNG